MAPSLKLMYVDGNNFQGEIPQDSLYRELQIFTAKRNPRLTAAAGTSNDPAVIWNLNEPVFSSSSVECYASLANPAFFTRMEVLGVDFSYDPAEACLCMPGHERRGAAGNTSECVPCRAGNYNTS